MLWKTLKAVVTRWIEAHPEEQDSLRVIEAAQTESKTVLAYLDSVNALNAQLLRDVIPAAFPRHLRIGELVVDQNIHGQWRVAPKFKNGMLLKRRKSHA